MYNKRKILGLVPARSGSKGIKNKNVILVNQKPLIAYTIEAAKHSKFIDDVVVSTDSINIAEIAKKYGADVPFLRPSYLAGDTTKTIEVVLHCVNALKKVNREYSDIILLQPTQPLRTTEDIDNAIKHYYQNNRMSLVSISEVKENPLLMRKVTDGAMFPLLNKNSTCRRQDMEKYYKVNGCIYINEIRLLNETTSFNDNVLPYVMLKEHSVDIDEQIDVVIAEFYLLKASNESSQAM